ncbi:hypothetical protein BD769DRAFT_1667966 [Suillus cothurnatus]|nr:hypothetical protein BD769DRAFT_1667966 [Suillus cothurnatus]
MFNANPSTGAVPPPAESEGEGEGGNDNDNLPSEPDPYSEEIVRPTPSNGRSSTTPTTIRVRRSTRLSSKFLQVFGCMIDVAVDGVGAVNKMNLEKYDLVLMDIVMPKWTESALTNLIRQFDHMTPIISMTSNSKPTITKEGLLDMLEKHLMHLKVIQQMSKHSRLERRNYNDNASSSNSSSSSSNSSSSSSLHPTLGMSGYDDDGRINPLAGMGLSDERYAAILRDIVTQESFSGVGVSEGFSSVSQVH